MEVARVGLKVKLAKNQLVYYEDSYQFLNPLGEQQLIDQGWSRYAILRKLRIDPLEPTQKELREVLIRRYELQDDVARR